MSTESVSRTPRKELIERAAVRLRRWRDEKVLFDAGKMKYRTPQPEDAVIAIIDECKGCPKGTLDAKMLEYYKNASDIAITRLLHAIDDCSWTLAKIE
jgi:hypothetical protein